MVKTYSVPEFLCRLECERNSQEFERYLAECKKDRKKYKALVLLFASTMMICIGLAHFNVIPYFALKLMLGILNKFSELTSMFLTLFGALFVMKHSLKHKNPAGGFNLVMPVALGITFSIYIAKCIINFLMVI